MLKYFKKLRNFNRIRKLIKTKAIRRITGISGLPLRTIYVINDTIYIYQDSSFGSWTYFYQDDLLCGCTYSVREGGKEVYLGDWYSGDLFQLAEKQYQWFETSIKNLNNN